MTFLTGLLGKMFVIFSRLLKQIQITVLRSSAKLCELLVYEASGATSPAGDEAKAEVAVAETEAGSKS